MFDATAKPRIATNSTGLQLGNKKKLLVLQKSRWHQTAPYPGNSAGALFGMLIRDPFKAEP